MYQWTCIRFAEKRTNARAVCDEMVFAGIEVACNLLSREAGLIDNVLDSVSKKAQAKGVEVLKAYVIGRTAPEYADLACKLL